MLNAHPIEELQRRIALYDDESAYKELFLRHYRSLNGFAFSFVNSREWADEIVSDVFISIWQNRKGLENIKNLRVYLYVSVKNTSLQYLLRKCNKRSITLDELNVELVSSDPSPDQVMINAEMMRRISHAIDQLPPRCKLVYKLVKEDGLRYREVASILDISIKTIDNQLAIALSKIAKALNVTITKVLSP